MIQIWIKPRIQKKSMVAQSDQILPNKTKDAGEEKNKDKNVAVG